MILIKEIGNENRITGFTSQTVKGLGLFFIPIAVAAAVSALFSSFFPVELSKLVQYDMMRLNYKILTSTPHV